MIAVRYDNGTGIPKDIPVDTIFYVAGSDTWVCEIGTETLRIANGRVT